MVAKTCLTVLLVMITAGCSTDDNTVLVYQEQCAGSLKSGKCDEGWHELRTRKYTLYKEKQEVISVILGGGIPPTKYTKCTIADKGDWYCSYNDYSGSFGVSDGSFWEKPSWEGTRTISILEHYVYRIRYFFDKF